MESQNQLRHDALSSSVLLPRSRLLITGAVAAVLLAAFLCANGSYVEAAIAAATVMCAIIVVAANVTIESILVAWFVTTPVASFFIRVPVDRSIITYDRVVFGLLVVVLLLKWRGTTQSASPKSAASDSSTLDPRLLRGSNDAAQFSITRFEAAWSLLSLAALASAVFSTYNPAYAARMAIDAFWLPLVAFHIARHHFDLQRSGKPLVLGSVLLSLFLVAFGAIEFASGTDLFRFKGAEILRDGERRINGPFVSDSSYSIICLLLFVFLLGAVRLLRIRFDRAGRVAYALAIGGAAAGAMLPLFRSVAFALVICWFVLQFGRHSKTFGPGVSRRLFQQRTAALAALAAIMMITAITLTETFAPSVFQGRLSDPRTVFGRLATWRAAVTLTLAHPSVGIGLGNYSDYFREHRSYRGNLSQDVFDARAADSPHSNVLWIGAELGVVSLVLYLAANVFLFLMAWRVLKRPCSATERIAAHCFIALLFAYWIPGLALASGEYSDLNLYFFFLLGSLSRQLSIGREVEAL